MTLKLPADVDYMMIECKKFNYINNLHWSSIKDLTENYDVIFIGDIKSQGIVKNNKNHMLNRDMNDLKFHLLQNFL